MIQILTPNKILWKSSHFNPKIIFLAGPIRSAPDWHNEAIEFFLKKFNFMDKNLNPLQKDFIIASPNRNIHEEYSKYLIGEDNSIFQRQRQWETYYLRKASENGCIMFWLPGEKTHRCEKVYGAMTRIELGQTMVHHFYNPDYNFCLGTDYRFNEINTIEFDLKNYTPHKKINTTLRETCLEAIGIAFK